jgi:predicted peptidase
VEVKDFQARSQKMGANKSIVYRLFVPKNYSPSKKYPLMLTLHGAGERGSDDSSQLFHYFNKEWAGDSVQVLHPCFVAAPQCPLDSQWVNTPWANGSYDMDKVPISGPMQAVAGILDSLEKEFNIDPDRVYVSGLSMGGYGTWYLIAKFPGRFAAAVPVCGAGDPKKAAVIGKLPIWAFHAEDDAVVPVAGSRDMVKALQAIGGSPKYTEYPKAMGINHFSWVPASKSAELITWVFQQARPASTAIPVRERYGLAPSRPDAAARTDALGKIHSGGSAPTAPADAPGFLVPLP